MSLGVLSLLAVLAWRFPELLTTRELREVYDPEQTAHRTEGLHVDLTVVRRPGDQLRGRGCEVDETDSAHVGVISNDRSEPLRALQLIYGVPTPS